MVKLKFKSDILSLLINQFFINLFYSFFLSYIKMSKSISARYYEENKESLPKELMKDTKKRKKATIWSWTLQKSLRRWKTKACWV